MTKSLSARLRSILQSFGALALISLTSVSAQADDKQLCVPPGDGVPGAGGPPEWTGATANTAVDDPRWRGATSQSYGTGTAGVPHSRLRAVQKSNKLYLSFQVLVDADAEPLPQDSVYIALAQNSGATHHLLRMQLTATADTALDTTKVALSHFTWNAGTSTWDGAAPPTWAENAAAALKIDPADGSPEWAINVQINYTALGLTGPFKMWTGTAVQLTSSPPVLYSTYVWPLGTAGPWSSGPTGGTNQDIQNGDWGDVQIGTAACTTGVSLTMNNIGVLNGSTYSSQISTTTNNIFGAKPDYNGVTAAAGKVKAKFRIANWGSATNWTTIPGFEAVGSDALGEIQQTCVQGGTPACPVPPAGNNHQCMLVELSSSANLTFLNDSVYRNMDFVSNSFFERDAEISIKGVPPLAGSKGKRDVYLYVNTTNMPAKARGPLDEKALRGALDAAEEYRRHVYHVDPKLQPKLRQGDKPLPVIKSSKTPHELLKTVWPTYEVHVYYDSGKELTVGTTKGKRLIPAPSFGFFVHHAGELEGWLQDMVGLNATLVEVAPHLFKVEVPDNGAIKLVNRIEGITPGRPPTLSQIGKPPVGGGVGGGTTPPPLTCKECPKVTPGPHGCGSCRVLGGSTSPVDLGVMSLLALAAVLRLRRRSR